MVPGLENCQKILLKCGGNAEYRSSILAEFGGKGER